jgi:hypothetical protein
MYRADDCGDGDDDKEEDEVDFEGEGTLVPYAGVLIWGHDGVGVLVLVGGGYENVGG